MDRFSKLEYQKYKTHLWADCIELITLWDVDNETSKAQFIDRLYPDRKDIIVDDNEDDDLEKPEKEDSVKTEVNSIYSLLSVRSVKHGDNYPFFIEDETLFVKDNLQSNHRLYIYLLAASHLKYFNKIQLVLTSEFEHLSLIVMRLLVPAGSEVHVSGKNALEGAPKRYTGNKNNKLKLLSKDLGYHIKEDQRDFAATDNGDAGVDIVGWKNFIDGNRNKLVFIGQSKCSDEWHKAGTDALTSLNKIFNINVAPTNFYFIPFCFRRADFEWEDSGATTNLVLVDRFRFLTLIDAAEIDNFVQDSTSISRIEELMKEHEKVI